MDIVIIGSGFGGLYAACRLQMQGHSVTVIDKRDKPGGRAYVYEQDGFKFDGGPTIITAPWLIHELFERAGRRSENYVKIVRLTRSTTFVLKTVRCFVTTEIAITSASEIRRFNPDDLAGYEKFFRQTENIYKVGFDLIDKPFTRFSDMMRVIPDMVRLQSQRSVAGFVNRYIKDERLRQVFSFHPLLVGGNPFQSTSIYALIHKLEQEYGVWYAMGGTGALVRAFVKLFEDLGGTLRLNTEAREIVIDERTRRASGVRIVAEAGEELIAADVVVSNGDVAWTYLNLVPAHFRRKNTDRKIKRLRYSMSLFVIYFGTDKKYDDIAHHEIIMGKRYRGLVTDIFKNKTLSEDFSLYLHRPTATDPSMAPEGCDSWYVLSPVPHLGGAPDWARDGDAYRDSIIKYLEERYLPNLSQHIISEHRIDPVHFRDTLNSHLGSAFSVEPILTQSAWFRPHNLSEDVANLYFVGAGTHPGAGLPGVMSSGKIVAEMIGEAGERRGRQESNQPVYN
jgi:phytoene desaturase